MIDFWTNFGDENRSSFIYYSLTLGWVSIFSIYKGLQLLKQKRIVADTPTSQIKNSAIGNSIEIKGNVVNFDYNKYIESPLLGRRCIAYKWVIEECIHNGKRSVWTQTGLFYSDQYLKISDMPNKSMLVRFDELNFDFWKLKKTEKVRSFFSISNKKIVKIVKKYPKLADYIKHEEKLGRFRVTEYTIMPHHSIYLLGAATPLGELEDLSKMNLSNKVFGDENNFNAYKKKISNVQFLMKKSERFGDILKMKEVLASDYEERKLIRKLAFRAYLE